MQMEEEAMKTIFERQRDLEKKTTNPAIFLHLLETFSRLFILSFPASLFFHFLFLSRQIDRIW